MVFVLGGMVELCSGKSLDVFQVVTECAWVRLLGFQSSSNLHKTSVKVLPGHRIPQMEEGGTYLARTGRLEASVMLEHRPLPVASASLFSYADAF